MVPNELTNKIWRLISQCCHSDEKDPANGEQLKGSRASSRKNVKEPVVSKGCEDRRASDRR
jgi:hypothetical protein